MVEKVGPLVSVPSIDDAEPWLVIVVPVPPSLSPIHHHPTGLNDDISAGTPLL